MTSDDGIIILPTKNRPASLKRFVHQYYLTGATLPISVVFDAKDAWKYNDVKTPDHWRRVTAPAGTPIGEIFNLIFKKYPDKAFYGMVADDVLPETALWDIVLRDSCLPDKIAWGACGLQNEKLPVHPFIGGDLLRKLGWWAAPGLKHWFVDNAWKSLTLALNNGVYLPNIKMTHLHPVNGRAPNDRTYEEQPSHIADQHNYDKFMKGGEFQAAIERVLATP